MWPACHLGLVCNEDDMPVSQADGEGRERMGLSSDLILHLRVTLIVPTRDSSSSGEWGH